jgi:hypothetical protein
LLWRVTLAWQRRIRAALAPYELTHGAVRAAGVALVAGRPRVTVATQARLAEQAGTDSMMTSQVVRKLEGAT